jgi:membrane associated rhomboid family serine protease
MQHRRRKGPWRWLLVAVVILFGAARLITTARHDPEFLPPVLTGVSLGAIGAVAGIIAAAALLAYRRRRNR